MKFEKYLVKEEDSPKYRCTECGWIYDPKKEGKPFSEQPDTYKCPKCGAPKSVFEKIKTKKHLSENKAPEKVEQEIFNFLKENPSPDDNKIHALSDKLNIDTHKFEAYIYDILGSIIGSGRAKEKDITEKDVDSKELKMGIKVEMEHTTNKTISKRIALDHLAEISDYYTRLAKMESDAGIED